MQISERQELQAVNVDEIKAIYVKKFVGYDKNGAGVYEGDLLIDDYEQEHIAEIYDRPALVAQLTLKETS